MKITGRVSRGKIGIQIAEIPADVTEALKLPEKQGVQINMVEPGGAVAKASIQAGNIILAINGQVIKKINEFPRLIGETQLGDKIRLTVWRKGGARNVPVIVEAIDDPSVAQKSAQNRQDKTQSESVENILGMEVADLPGRPKISFGPVEMSILRH